MGPSNELVLVDFIDEGKKVFYFVAINLKNFKNPETACSSTSVTRLMQ